MKHLLKKLFFADAPAQGAFFAITLSRIGFYATFPLLPWVMISGVEPPDHQSAMTASSWITLALLAALSVYLGLMVFRFYYQSCRESLKKKTAFWVMLVLYGIMAAVAINYGSAAGLAVTAALFGAWIFPLLLIPKISWWCYLARALSLMLGVLLLIAMLLRTRTDFRNILPISNKLPSDEFFEQIIINYQLSGGAWILGILLSLLLILTGYLLTAKIFGDSRSVPFRQMFGKGVFTLWGFAIAAYLVFLAMAIAASRQAAQDIKDMEQRFGRPMTADALGKLYFGNDKPDPEFWKNIEKYSDQCDLKVASVNFSGNLDIVPEPLLTLWRRQFDKHDLAAWEQAFAGDIPPEARKYEPGILYRMPFGNPRFFWNFSWLEFWRIRFALMDNDVKSALAAYGRMTNAANYLLRETYVMSGLIWAGVQNIRLNALQLLLESGKLTDAQLQTLAVDLQTTEKQIPAIHERCIYGEAVFSMDVFDMIGRGFEDGDTKYKTAPYQTLRFLIPQLWWYAAKEKSYMAQYYNIKNFNEAANTAAGKNNFRISDSLLPELKSDAAIFDRITARLRAAGVVIRAIEYQRQHGEYPKTLDNLPIDPFNGEPMQYRVGDCEIERSVAVCNDKKWQTKSVTQTVPGVICWSVGRNLANDGGTLPDDISFIIQIKP